MQFKVGHTVRLKSGGPLMTADALAAGGKAWICIWFDGTERKSGTFHTESLVHDDGQLQVHVTSYADD